MLSAYRIKIAVVAIILTIIALPHQLLAADYNLIIDSQSGPSLASQPESLTFYPASRSRQIALNHSIAMPGALAPDDTLVLNLFDDTAYRARISHITTNVNGTVTIQAQIEDHQSSYITISTTANRTLGWITLPDEDKQYLIISTSATGAHYLLDLRVNQQDQLEDAPVLVPVISLQNQLESQPIVNADPNDQIKLDVMIIYTAAAKTWAIGYGGIENIIAQAVANGQLALENSGTYVQIRLVKSLQTNYNESGSTITDATRLTNTSDGYMDDVHAQRNLYSADIVSMFCKIDDTGGAGWLLNTTSGRPDLAFNICRVQQVGNGYTLIHEIGHNCGCGHRSDQATQPGPGLFSYSSGWHWRGADGVLYCSVMSYTDGGYSTVPHFSNPSVDYKTVATGSSYADNARTIRATKQVIGSYRLGAGPTVGTVSPSTGRSPIGQWTIFTATYSHANGVNDLSTVSILINNTTSSLGGCQVLYNKAENKFYMQNNAGTLIGGIVRGAVMRIETENAAIDCSGSTASISDKTITVSWKVMAKSTMTSLACDIYLKAQDTSGNSTGWIDKGDYMFAGSAPKIGTITPSADSETWQSFITTYSDADSASDIFICSFLISKTLTNQGGAHFFYNKFSNRLYMKNNNGKVVGGVIRGAAATISTENAVIDTAATAVSISGNTVTIVWRVKLKRSMAGKLCNEYLKAEDISGQIDGWTDKGDLFVR